jgi:hypothetical protein
MKISKKLEKSRGILAFAYNVETIDYISIAKQTLDLASKKLGIPYTLITDQELKNDVQNSRYDIDTESFVTWRNVGRHNAYDLTPYDETLVIDVDYLITDDNLNKIFDLEWDYILQRQSFALTAEWPKLMGENSLPYVWATVFAFRKTKKSELFFRLIGRIQRNYAYYCALFNVEQRNFRNDYAFAMADIIINGYTISSHSIPDNMLAINQSIKSIQLKRNQFVIRDKEKSYVTPVMNLHIMSKAYLQSNNFKSLVSKLINET